MTHPKIDPRPLSQALEEVDPLEDASDWDYQTANGIGDVMNIANPDPAFYSKHEKKPLPFKGFKWKRTPCRFPDGGRP